MYITENNTQENVRLSVARLMRYPWIRSAVDAGRGVHTYTGPLRSSGHQVDALCGSHTYQLMDSSHFLPPLVCLNLHQIAEYLNIPSKKIKQYL